MRKCIFIVFMGFLASLFGCAKQPQPKPAPATMFIIDFAHDSAGTFHHGTFSLIHGKVGVTWTIHESDGKKTNDIPMTEEEFRVIWDGLFDIEDFKLAAVTDPSRHMDPKLYYIVGAIFELDGKKGMRAYLIPVSSASTVFKQWLSRLRYAGE